jgi:hypothetical protein
VYKKHTQVARDLGVSVMAVIMRGRMKTVRDQSRLFTSGSKADDWQDWVNVIEEYKKSNEQVPRVLGVAGSGSGTHRIPSQFTWANVLIPFVDDAIWYILAAVATFSIIWLQGRRGDQKEARCRTAKNQPKEKEKTPIFGSVVQRVREMAGTRWIKILDL